MISFALQAQQQSTAPAGASAAGSLSSSLGLYVFPAKSQTAHQQSTDEGACFGWAKSQTGIDPMAIKPQTQQSPPPDQAGSGSRVRGAARGAAGGALIGAVAGDAGTGAAAGAVAGTLAGGAAKRQAQRDAAAQQQAAAQSSVAAQKANYNKAFSACMEGKGYTVK
jgi:hypothetical protein